MKRYAFLILILLFAVPSYAGGGATMMMVGGTAAGGGADSCTGGLLLSAHFENSDTITDGTPAGCSVGDTTWTLTAGCSYSSVQAYDGTYSLLCDGTNYESASVSVTDNNIISFNEGRLDFWMYLNTVVVGDAVIRVGGDASNYMYLIVAAADNTNLTMRHRGNASSSTFSSTSNNITVGQWQHVIMRWRVGGSPNTMSITIDESTTNFTSALTAPTTGAATIHVGGEPASSSSDVYIDLFKSYSSSELL